MTRSTKQAPTRVKLNTCVDATLTGEPRRSNPNKYNCESCDAGPMLYARIVHRKRGTELKNVRKATSTLACD